MWPLATKGETFAVRVCRCPLARGYGQQTAAQGPTPERAFLSFSHGKKTNKKKKKPKYLHSPEGLGELGRVPSPYLATQSQKTFPLPKCLGNRPARQHSPSSRLGGCHDRRDVGTEGRTGRPDSPSRGPRARSAARRGAFF